jgi:mono/diheme cytochrome c family protein
MRAHQFLLEYRRDITLTKQGDALVQHARGFDGKELTGEEILEQLEAGDPTKNKMYVLWLIRQYLNKQFRLEDMTRVRGVLRAYHGVKNRLPLEQRDIGRMTYYALEDLVDSFTDADATPVSSSQYSQIPDLKILYDGPYGFLAIPQTEEASCAVGSGTRWCTAARENNLFHEYNEQGDLYVWIEKGDKFQFHFEDQQFMDSRDRPISPEKMYYFRNTNPITKKLFMEREREILASGDAERVYAYAENIIRDRWVEAEPLIMKDPEWAYSYARNVIEGRWAEAEPYIMKDPYWAFHYARDVIQGRWVEAEPYIMKNPQVAYWYAMGVIRGRWAEAEPYIMKDPEWGYWYARDVIRGRWTEAEPYVMKDPRWAHSYAKYVIRGR